MPLRCLKNIKQAKYLLLWELGRGAIQWASVHDGSNSEGGIEILFYDSSCTQILYCMTVVADKSRTIQSVIKILKVL